MDKEEWKPSPWLRLEHRGWTIVIPEADIKPHAWLEPGKSEVVISLFDCPCKPSISWDDKEVVHNSFEDEKRIEDSMKKYEKVI